MIANFEEIPTSQCKETEDHGDNKKKVTFNELDEVFDEIEIVDEWAIIYHTGNESSKNQSSNFSQKIYNEIKQRNEKCSTLQVKNKTDEIKHFNSCASLRGNHKSPVKLLNTKHCEISLRNERSPVVQKVKYYKPSNFSDMKATSQKLKTKTNNIRRKRAHVLRQALSKLKSLREVNNQIEMNKNELNENYEDICKDINNSQCFEKSPEIKKTYHYSGSQLANDYLNTKGSKYVCVNLDSEIKK